MIDMDKMVEVVARELVLNLGLDPDDRRNGEPAWVYKKEEAQIAIKAFCGHLPGYTKDAYMNDMALLDIYGKYQQMVEYGKDD